MFAKPLFGNIQDWPYSHCCESGVFGPELYKQILENRPEPSELSQIGEVRGAKMKKYPERFCFLVGDWFCRKRLPEHKRTFWREFTNGICRGDFAREALRAFGVGSGMSLGNEIYLVRDSAGYSLGPHTDTPKKVISVIFYLADDDSHPEFGTSVYVPKGPMTDPTGKHHDRDGFTLVKTAPYAPNSMFAFKRTDNSFHGVEPVTGHRWALLYDIQRK